MACNGSLGLTKYKAKDAPYIENKLKQMLLYIQEIITTGTRQRLAGTWMNELGCTGGKKFTISSQNNRRIVWSYSREIHQMPSRWQSCGTCVPAVHMHASVNVTEGRSDDQ